MKIIKTENEDKPWRLIGRNGPVCKAEVKEHPKFGPMPMVVPVGAETKEELINNVLIDYEQMREALSEICTLADVERLWPFFTTRLIDCCNEIKELASKALR